MKSLKTKLLTLISYSVFSVSAMADKAAQEASGANISSLSNWPIVLLVLAGMVVFIFSLAWFVKRFGGLNFAGNRDMRIISTIPVGTRERITLLDVKGQQFLIGVTAHQISHLHSFDEAVVSPAQTETAFRQSEFFTKLQQVMNPQKRTRSVSVAGSTAGSDEIASSDDQPVSAKRDDHAL